MLQLVSLTDICRLFYYTGIQNGGLMVGFYTSGLVAQHSDCFHIELLDSKNIGVAVGISFLSHVQAEIRGGGNHPSYGPGPKVTADKF
jgi:hypothetical protein